jgi:hypothetical protein
MITLMIAHARNLGIVASFLKKMRGPQLVFVGL